MTGAISWDAIPGWTDEHLLGLYDWAIDRAPRDRFAIIVEVGVAFGRSFAYAGRRIAESKKEIVLMGFDPWIVPEWMAPEHRAIVDEHGSFERACFDFLVSSGHQNKFPMRRTSVDAAARLASPHFGGVDFVFIDADHTYESLSSDLRAWWPLVRSGGAIAGHDHTPNFPGIEQACREFFIDGYETIGTCFRKVKP